jgi:hypothetical protein
MRTLFDMGWTPASVHWSGGLGIAAPGDEGSVLVLMQEERNVIVRRISQALDKVRPLDALISWSGTNDPQLRRTLGSDADRFWALSNSIAPLYQQSVGPVLERLQDPDPEFWAAPNDAEARDIDTWIAGVDEMHRIYLAHLIPQAAKPPTSAPTRPGAAPTPPRPGGAAAASPMILGVPQDTFLIGSGAAIGVGILGFLLLK